MDLQREARIWQVGLLEAASAIDMVWGKSCKGEDEAAGTAGRPSAVVTGFGYDLFACPGEKGKATLRLLPVLLVVSNSDGWGSPQNLI